MGFIKLTSTVGSVTSNIRVNTNSIHSYRLGHTGRTFVRLIGSDSLLADETPEQIDELIAEASK